MPESYLLLALAVAIGLAVALRRAYLAAAELVPDNDAQDEDEAPAPVLDISLSDFLEFLSRVRQAIRQSYRA